jgi:hypothetical protein
MMFQSVAVLKNIATVPVKFENENQIQLQISVELLKAPSGSQWYNSFCSSNYNKQYMCVQKDSQNQMVPKFTLSRTWTPPVTI